MKILKPLLFSVLFLFIASTAQAFDGITYYGAKISYKDRHASDGYPLKTVRAILRQDRANFHRFGRRDGADQHDNYFSSKANRAMFARARIVISSSLRRQIISGRPVYISVFVYPHEIRVRRGLPSR